MNANLSKARTELERHQRSGRVSDPNKTVQGMYRAIDSMLKYLEEEYRSRNPEHSERPTLPPPQF